MRIVIGGDLCPIGRNERLFSQPGALTAARSALGEYDLAIANLECPLIMRPTPILKGGPVLGASVSTAVGVAEMGVQVVCLANNHIMDHGDIGLHSTLEAVQAAGLRTVGAGANLSAASKPLVLEGAQTVVAVLAFAEREYSYATDTGAGACPLDTNLVVRQLRAIPQGTFTIVLVHGGNEHFPLPSPWLQDTCRLMIELGANVVICQHSHCIGACESYLGGLIVYGQGNLLFDMASRHQTWWEGMIVGLNVRESHLASYEFIPTIQKPGQEGILRMPEAERSAVLAQIDGWARIVTDQAQLRLEWSQFCRKKRRSYQTLLFGYGRPRHVLNKLTGMADWISRFGRMNIGNALRCASHLEVLRSLYSLGETTGRDGERDAVDE